MKVMFVVPGLLYGGAERVISILSNQFIKNNIEVYIYVIATKERCVYEMDKGVRISYYLDDNNFSAYDLLKNIRIKTKIEKPDYIISFANDVCAYCCIATLGMNVPVIYSERNDPNNNYRTRKERLFRFIVKRFAQAFVFQTEGAKVCYRVKRNKKVSVILNPMECSNVPVHDFEKENKEIVSVGRLERQKNQKVLIDAFAMIANEFTDYILTIYGEGTLREQLEKQVNDRGLINRVRLPGAQKDIFDKIKGATVFVLSSDYEGLPNALIEAMAIGLPCVSTDCTPGGARELICSGINGEIVMTNNSTAIAEGLRRLLLEKELRVKYGKNALRIKDRINPNEIASQWISFMSNIKQ